MAGHSSEDPFSRAMGGTERGDPFASMREQMEKERDNFFRGSEWQNEPNPTRPGLFNRVSKNIMMALNIFSPFEMLPI